MPYVLGDRTTYILHYVWSGTYIRMAMQQHADNSLIMCSATYISLYADRAVLIIVSGFYLPLFYISVPHPPHLVAVTFIYLARRLSVSPPLSAMCALTMFLCVMFCVS